MLCCAKAIDAVVAFVVTVELFSVAAVVVASLVVVGNRANRKITTLTHCAGLDLKCPIPLNGRK